MTAKQLQNIITDTEKFIKSSHQHVADYKAKVEKFDDLITKGLKGLQEARDELDEMEVTFKAEANETRQQLEERLEEWINVVSFVSEDAAKPLTQDDLAELTVLGMLDPTIEEMDKYAIKYRNSPLALQLIQKIAKEKEIMFSLPPNRIDKAKEIVSTLKRDIQYFSNSKVKSPLGHVNWVGTGDILRHKQMHQEYAELETDIKKA